MKANRHWLKRKITIRDSLLYEETCDLEVASLNPSQCDQKNPQMSIKIAQK